MALRTLVLATVLGAVPAWSAVIGSIAGLVRDQLGYPQIGAAVQLLNAEGRSLRTVYTDDSGAFLIDNLFPGIYGVRISVARLLPALREQIRVEPGTRSRLSVQLAGLFSSIQLVYPRPGEWRDMSEDWKWVLRTASATRPVLRFTPWEDREQRSVQRKLSGAIGPVQGMVQLSAGDGGRVSAFGSESDLGTAFAVATSLFGNSNLLVSGNLGYGSMYGAPSMGFHTSYSREMAFGAQPEVSFTVRQLFRPLQAGRALFGPGAASEDLMQAFTLGYQDRFSMGDLVRLEYGFLYDSISFLDRLQSVSSFGKLSYSIDEDTRVTLGFASGVPRPESSLVGDGALGRNLSALALFPRMSLVAGRPALQRGEHMEIGLQQKLGEDVFEAAAYRDRFSNAAVMGMFPVGLYAGGDLLPDLFSPMSSFNAGSYEATGYRVSYSRRLTEQVRAAIGYTYAGVLAAEREALATESPAELRSALRPEREHFVIAQLTMQVPGARTWIASSYQWARQVVVTPPDLFNSSAVRSLPGVNVMVRQPLPSVNYVRGKFEATAEIRNLLADGYIPMRTADGRRMVLIPSPRSFRGGFNFVF